METKNMLKNLSLMALALVLLLPGCGKKQEEATKKIALSETEEASLLASAEKVNEIPALKEEVDFFEDDSITEFAFIDDETNNNLELAEGEEIDEEMIDDEEYDDDNEELVFWEEDESISEEVARPQFKTVHFDLNKNEIKQTEKEALAENIKLAKEAVQEGKKIVVNGHCCQLGAPSYNIPLSERRAKVIKKEMVKQGIPEDSIKTVGWGQELPAVFSDSVNKETQIQELAPNRRAEITIS